MDLQAIGEHKLTIFVYEMSWIGHLSGGLPGAVVHPLLLEDTLKHNVCHYKQISNHCTKIEEYKFFYGCVRGAD